MVSQVNSNKKTQLILAQQRPEMVVSQDKKEVLILEKLKQDFNINYLEEMKTSSQDIYFGERRYFKMLLYEENVIVTAFEW